MNSRVHVPYVGPVIHDGVQHFANCPCARCQVIIAAAPVPTPLAYHACCGGVVKLTRTGPDTYRSTEVHNSHCKEMAS